MLKSYYLPSVNGEGYACGEGYAFIMIDTEAHLFATVSDYGNYACRWSTPGPDFRRFLLGCDGEYVRSYIASGRTVYDPDKTYAAVVERYIDEGHGPEPEELREHRLDDILDFHLWQREATIDTYGLMRNKPEPQSTAFVKKVWPRFVEVLRKELDEERIKDEALL